MLFRRTLESNVWHWRSQCSQFPHENADERAGLPNGGRLCQECEALDLRSALQRLTEEEQAELKRHRQPARPQTVVSKRQGSRR